jgi:hypothetical protein
MRAGRPTNNARRRFLRTCRRYNYQMDNTLTWPPHDTDYIPTGAYSATYKGPYDNDYDWPDDTQVCGALSSLAYDVCGGLWEEGGAAAPALQRASTLQSVGRKARRMMASRNLNIGVLGVSHLRIWLGRARVIVPCVQLQYSP